MTADEYFGKGAPCSEEAEQGLLGAFLSCPKTWDIISHPFDEEDFYRADHRRIFFHIRNLAESGLPFDVVTVYSAIEAAGEINVTGGLAYLEEIAMAAPVAADVQQYADRNTLQQ